MSELNENTKASLSIRTLIELAVLLVGIASSFFFLQAKLAGIERSIVEREAHIVVIENKLETVVKVQGEMHTDIRTLQAQLIERGMIHVLPAKSAADKPTSIVVVNQPTPDCDTSGTGLVANNSKPSPGKLKRVLLPWTNLQKTPAK